MDQTTGAHLFQKMFQLLEIKDKMVVEGLWFGEWCLQMAQ